MAIPQKVHLVGIGGSGMSGLARVLHERGCTVTGSDVRSTDVTVALAALGIRVIIGHDSVNVPADAQMVIRSAAVKDDNPEVTAARERGLPVLKYAQALGELSREKQTVAVCGTHGKTTTTAMLSFILQTAGMEPTFIVGSELRQLQTNGKCGRGEHFVCEACEYDRSFLNLSPRWVVMTNIEEDHLDYYKDINEIIQAFCQFADKATHLFGCIDNPNVQKVVRQYRDRFETTSLHEDADWRARNIRVQDGVWRFEVLKYGKLFDEFSLGVYGIHNVSNALLAIACATHLGVGKEIIQVALDGFKGTRRRMEVVGEVNGFVVVDDYAHHPTEIQATLRAIREKFAGRKVWCVFQPHQHSRTRFLMKDFARSFADADVVLLPEIYAARDSKEDQERVSSRDLAKLVNDTGKPALYMPEFDEVVEFLRRKAEKNTVIVTMGAGDVGEIARRLVNKS